MSLPDSTPKYFHSPIRRLQTAWIYVVAISQQIKNKNTYFDCLRNNIPGVLEFKNGLHIEVQGKRCIQFLNSIIFNKIYGEPNQQKTIIDIGANKGLFCLYFGYALRKNVKIYAFEPHPQTYKFLQRNIQLNDLESNIFASQKCVSGIETNQKSFFVARESFDYSMFNEYQTDDEIVVKNITLKQFIEENDLEEIDLLKLNCEGAEYEILMQTPIEYVKRIKEIRMEYHNFELDGKTYDINPLIGYLENNNFITTNYLPYAKEHGIIWFKNQGYS